MSSGNGKTRNNIYIFLCYFTLQNLAPKKCIRVDILRNWNVTLKSDAATDESIFKLNVTFVSVTSVFLRMIFQKLKCDEVGCT